MSQWSPLGAEGNGPGTLRSKALSDCIDDTPSLPLRPHCIPPLVHKDWAQDGAKETTQSSRNYPHFCLSRSSWRYQEGNSPPGDSLVSQNKKMEPANFLAIPNKSEPNCWWAQHRSKRVLLLDIRTACSSFLVIPSQTPSKLEIREITVIARLALQVTLGTDIRIYF